MPAVPHEQERELNPIKWNELKVLLDEAHRLLNIHEHEYDHSIRHTVVKDALKAHLPPDRVQNLPLGVKRREDNPRFVTWTGTDTVLGDTVKKPGFRLLAEHQVTKVLRELVPGGAQRIYGALLRNLKNDQDVLVKAKVCGSVS